MGNGDYPSASERLFGANSFRRMKMFLSVSRERDRQE